MTIQCECTVPIDADGDEKGRFNHTLIHPAGKMFTCTECNVTYPMGTWHIEETIKWTTRNFGDKKLTFTDRIETYRTCEHCYSLRQVFFSDGWYYTMLWEDMYVFIDETEGDISVTCIRELTDVARGKVLDHIEEVWDETN